MKSLLACWRLAAALGLACAAAGVAAQHPHTAAGPRVRPQLASGAAFAPDGRLWLTGLDSQGRLFVQAAPADDLSRWAPARVLDTAGDTVAADGENRPKLAFGPQGRVVLSYTQPLARPYTGRIRMLHSTDGGQTFSLPATVHADRQEITHRFESIAFDAQGVLHTVWIDKRDMEAAPRVGKRSSYRGAAIYRNESRDGGASFGPDLKVADHSCECCRIALARGADGRLRAMWRHVFEPNVRDHGFAVLGDAQPLQPVRATDDDWPVDACPHHGPGLAPAPDGGFHAVWFGIRREPGGDVAAVRYARLAADGTPQPGSVRTLPDEWAEHADVMAAGAKVAVVWRSVEGARSRLLAWLSRDGGAHFELRELAQRTGENDHPRLAQQGERMVVVWRNPQEVQVHELRF